jgi:PEP-CTERM motif
MKFHLQTSALYFALALVPAYCTTITTYSNPATWQAATSAGYQTVTFEGLTPPGTSTPYYSSTGVTASGVDFIGYNSAGVSDVQVVDTSAVSWYDWGTGDALIQSLNRPSSSSPLPYINIILPANITSLGLDLFTNSPQALSYTITVAGNQYTVPSFSQPTLAFWGITSDTPITSIQVTLAGTTFNGGSNELLDNFSFGASDLTAAPEAGTYLLIGSGLIGFVLLRKRLISGKAGREL